MSTTGDFSVLEEAAPFLTARSLEPGEDEAYLAPEIADESADVYEHCCRALDRSLTRGAHGLPLMGTGDWNDGMNRVGREGRGESVWLGFFLVHVIDRFLPFCERRGDGARVARYSAHRAGLVTGAPTMTTERPSARRTATSAGSTRSHRPGRSSPTSHRPSAPRRHWRRWRRCWSRSATPSSVS